jgi:hypothetical protein
MYANGFFLDAVVDSKRESLRQAAVISKDNLMNARVQKQEINIRE